jgi:hypothetical protein
MNEFPSGEVTLWVPPFVHETAASFAAGVTNARVRGQPDGRGISAARGLVELGVVAQAGGGLRRVVGGRLAHFGPQLDASRDRSRHRRLQVRRGRGAVPAGVAGLGPHAGGGAAPPEHLRRRLRAVRAPRTTRSRCAPGSSRRMCRWPFASSTSAPRGARDNGLAAVLTQYLMMGLVGYPFILPDMVGGNEYMPERSVERAVRAVGAVEHVPADDPALYRAVARQRSTVGGERRSRTVCWSYRETLAPLFPGAGR